MKRSLIIPSVVSLAALFAFAPLAACDLTQELQGAGADGGAGTPPPAALGDAAPSPVTPTPDGGKADAAAKGPISICVPSASRGSVKILVDGSENPYMHDVTDIAFTTSRVFLLSTPFSFIGAPYGGGAVDSYSMTATIPSFMAFAIAPAEASVAGSRANQNLGGTELPGDGGHIFALKGSTSSSSDRPGEVLVDGADVVFWTHSPAQLVQGSLSGGAERVIADYPDATKRTITALALDATDIWFASVLTNGAFLTGGMLHRVPRAGGAVVDVVSLPEGTAAGGILFDGNSIYMPEGIRGAGEFMLAYEKSGGTVTYRSLMSKALGSSRVLFDGTFFYWAESNGADTCNGTFKRRNKDNSPEETLLTNLDTIFQLRARSGAFYLGSGYHAFRKPATPGQLIEWKP